MNVKPVRWWLLRVADMLVEERLNDWDGAPKREGQLIIINVPVYYDRSQSSTVANPF